MTDTLTALLSQWRAVADPRTAALIEVAEHAAAVVKWAGWITADKVEPREHAGNGNYLASALSKLQSLLEEKP
jgi:hypothetical protein